MELEKITPKIAQTWLNMNHSNRKLRDGVAEKYATDMANGKWTKCPAPIVFYADGDLADGQHRLWAIVLSGAPQSFYVLRDMKREDGLNIDTGLTRSIVDNGRISGADKSLSVALIATARAIDQGGSSGDSMSNAIKLEIVNKHREAASFAISFGPRSKGLRNAIVQGAVGRAWYWEEDRDRLKRFCAVLESGMPEAPSEHAAAALRKYIQDKGIAFSTSTMWRDSFLKSQNAIHYFMQGKSLSVVRSVQEEAYPLRGKPVQFTPIRKRANIKVA